MSELWWWSLGLYVYAFMRKGAREREKKEVEWKEERDINRDDIERLRDRNRGDTGGIRERLREKARDRQR